jgi:hypothetical protein
MPGREWIRAYGFVLTQIFARNGTDQHFLLEFTLDTEGTSTTPADPLTYVSYTLNVMHVVF